MSLQNLNNLVKTGQLKIANEDVGVRHRRLLKTVATTIDVRYEILNP